MKTSIIKKRLIHINNRINELVYTFFFDMKINISLNRHRELIVDEFDMLCYYKNRYEKILNEGKF